ncbi:hypothetical protein ABBQ38_002685 [Trebouxia sp. C0009 RCD-2024]
MRDISMDSPVPTGIPGEFMGVNFPSIEYSLDMLKEFQPQQPTEFFVPTTSIAPLDFVSDLFPLCPVPADPELQPLASAELPASPPAKQAPSTSSSGSAAKDRKTSRERQSSGRWSTRDKGPVTESRKLEVNREAQRRFRQRQKARSRSIETQLAEATTALHEMKAKHSQLEARNQLLEKVARLNHSQSPPSDRTLLWQGDPAWSEQAHTKGSQGLSLTFTLWDQDCVVTVDELSKLPLPKMAKLYTAFVQKLAVCLLEVDGDPNSPMVEQMNNWTAEATCFAVAVALYNPEAFRTFGQLRLDMGSVLPERMSDEAYNELLPKMEYTEAQVQDLLHLRRLYYGKLGQLYRQRKELRSQVPLACMGEVEGICATDNYTLLSGLAEKLRVNAAEEYSVFLQSFCAIFRGVQTSRQRGINMVHAYPYVAHKDRVVGMLAEQRGEPSMNTLLSDTSKSDLQHAADWQQVTAYLDSISMANMHMHQPLLRWH